MNNIPYCRLNYSLTNIINSDLNILVITKSSLKHRHSVMIVLLIALLVTAVGKFHAQEPVASLLINAKSAITALNRKQTGGVSEISRELQPPPFRASTVYISDHNSLHQAIRSNDEINRAYLTTNIYDMSSHKSNKTPSEDVKDHINGTTISGGEISTQPSKPNVPKSMNYEIENKDEGKKNSININGIEVTFGERSAFTGDQCPTGYVKVNGKCVEEE